jgi:signal peptidase
MGIVKGYIPYLGMVTIIMNDYPKLKWAVISTLAYFALSVRE